MVYQTEKFLSETGDKLDAADKNEVESALGNLKTALSGSDASAIKSATDALTQVFYKVSEKLYSQNAAQGNPGDPGAGASSSGSTGTDNNGQQYYDADYEVVDDDNKDK